MSNQTIVQDIIYSANQIKFYEKNDTSKFKKFIAIKKRKDLVKRVDQLDQIIISKALFLEFVSIYNGSYDFYKINGVVPILNPDTNVYSLSIKREDENMNSVSISTSNNQNSIIHIYCTYGKYYKNFSCYENLYSTQYDEIIEEVNKIMIHIIKSYLINYIRSK